MARALIIVATALNALLAERERSDALGGLIVQEDRGPRHDLRAASASAPA